ncbi:MAG TPA: DUF1569 domain-containing protein [Pyrinomonadaceae bacterium]|nr:DUF1569 domain-containing protein [Pyrinomonadaceae bacterium]
MKTLGKETDRVALLLRLGVVTPESQRRWGKMTPHQMICHLNDSFKSAIGERAVNGDKSKLLTRTVVRWIALYAPLKWPHGVRTMPENDQERGGTPPEDFKRDLDALVSMIERVTHAHRTFEWQRHPLFAEMSERDWMRWGYLHVDHHLRQFGV